MLEQVLQFVIDDSEEQIDILKDSPYLTEADWMRVRKRSGVNSFS